MVVRSDDASKMSDAQLLDYSKEHVYYELWMLFETAARLKDGSNVDDRLVKNSVIEAFTIHARTVAEFLYPDRPDAPRRPSDVTAKQYVRDVGPWVKARGPVPAVLQEVFTRTAKEIAHLTTGRHPFGAAEKSWKPDPILDALREPLSLFVAHVIPERLHVSVRTFIVEQGRAPTSAEAANVHSTSTQVTLVSGPVSDGPLTDVRTVGPPPSWR